MALSYMVFAALWILISISHFLIETFSETNKQTNKQEERDRKLFRGSQDDIVQQESAGVHMYLPKWEKDVTCSCFWMEIQNYSLQLQEEGTGVRHGSSPLSYTLWNVFVSFQWHLVATLPSLSMVLESLPSLTVGIVKRLFLLHLSPFQSSCMACSLLFTFLFCIFLQCSLSGASLSNMPSILNVPIFMASELNFMSPALTFLLSSRSIFSHTWWKFYLRPNLSNTELMDFLLHPLMFLYQSCYPIYSGSRELR